MIGAGSGKRFSVEKMKFGSQGAKDRSSALADEKPKKMNEFPSQIRLFPIIYFHMRGLQANVQLYETTTASEFEIKTFDAQKET